MTLSLIRVCPPAPASCIFNDYVPYISFRYSSRLCVCFSWVILIMCLPSAILVMARPRHFILRNSEHFQLQVFAVWRSLMNPYPLYISITCPRWVYPNFAVTNWFVAGSTEARYWDTNRWSFIKTSIINQICKCEILFQYKHKFILYIYLTTQY